MATISERLRDDQMDGWSGDAVCVPGTLASEAADVIDAMAADMRKVRRILANSELHETTRVVDAMDAIDAALSLARKGG